MTTASQVRKAMACQVRSGAGGATGTAATGVRASTGGEAVNSGAGAACSRGCAVCGAAARFGRSVGPAKDSIVGTSGMVPTPYFLAQEGKAAGAVVMDVNLAHADSYLGAGTALADFFLQGKAGEVLPQLVALV